MDDFPALSRPPCVEAIIELRASLGAPAGPAQRTEIAARLQTRFPTAQDLNFLTASVRLGDNAPPETTSGVIGVRLESHDKLWVLQAKADGLAVSRLAPYSGWASLLATLKEVWPTYVEIFGARTVTRLGVRFLNRIDVGSEPVDLDTLFTIGPKVPPSLPQGVASHRSQVVVPIPELGAAVTVSLSSEVTAPSGDGMLQFGVILDIDAFCLLAFPTDDPDLWEQLENLHTVKNRAFFGSLQREAWTRYI